MNKNSQVILGQLRQLKEQGIDSLQKLEALSWGMEENDQAEYITRLKEVEAAQQAGLRHLEDLIERYEKVINIHADTMRIDPLEF